MSDTPRTDSAKFIVTREDRTGEPRPLYVVDAKDHEALERELAQAKQLAADKAFDIAKERTDKALELAQAKDAGEALAVALRGMMPYGSLDDMERARAALAQWEALKK